jgi:hypothetical protein
MAERTVEVPEEAMEIYRKYIAGEISLTKKDRRFLRKYELLPPPKPRRRLTDEERVDYYRKYSREWGRKYRQRVKEMKLAKSVAAPSQ